MTDLTSLVRENIRSLTPYSSAREESNGSTGLFFDANESPYGVYSRYPDPMQKKLKYALADLKGVDPEQIFVGNGSDEAIDLLFRIFCEPGKDKALCLTPTYGMYGVSAQINNVELLKCKLTADFQIDREAITPFLADDDLKLLFLCSPNNPTGNILHSGDVAFLLGNFRGIVVIDEAYIDFASAPSWLRKLDRYPNLVVLQTLSKAWGLAGIRIGLAMANERLISFFNKVKSPYNISTLDQDTALQTVEKPEVVEMNVRLIRNERERITEALKKLAIIKKIYPSETNFLLVEVQDAEYLYRRLRAMQIIVRNRHSSVPNCLRITVGARRQNNLLLNALQTLNDE